MIINYKPQEQEVEIGRPYSYGKGFNWYMRVGPADVVFLGSTSEEAKLLDTMSAKAHIDMALSWTDFRYARTMEIK